MCPFIQAFVEKNTLIPTGYNTDGKTHTQYEKISHVLSVFFNSGTNSVYTVCSFSNIRTKSLWPQRPHSPSNMQ